MSLRKSRILNSITAALGVLPLGGWVYFTVLTRNSFRLWEFSGSNQMMCLGLAVLPILWWLVLAAMRGPQGIDLAAILFTLAACGWMLTLGTQWDAWIRAAAAESIGIIQRDRLRVTALVSLAVCLLPLGAVGIDALRRRQSK